MSDSVTVEHRRATKFGRRFVTLAITISILTMLGALANLYRVQENFQSCQANFFAYDSKARAERANASAATDQAQQKAFAAAAKLIDPSYTPTVRDTLEARAAFIASSTIAAVYDDAVKMYPYKDFRKECLS